MRNPTFAKAAGRQFNAGNRRQFLRWAVAAAGGVALSPATVQSGLAAASGQPLSAAPLRQPRNRVAITACHGYGAETRDALRRCFDLLGGIGSLVAQKTVTVKLNLTGTNFTAVFDRPVGESFMTHYATAFALAAELVDAGARRVRFVESTQSKAVLETTLGLAGWDVKALAALGRLEFENTRNLGRSRDYAELKVPKGGLLFSSIHVNQAYADTDVMVSLCKLKQHLTTGVTLSMKNLFGITPNTLYGDDAGSEDATGGRGPLHGLGEPSRRRSLPGAHRIIPNDPSRSVPQIITDICSARPIDLAIVDGITSMSGGEGPWCGQAGSLKLTRPGLLIAGLNPVATDAVGTAVMGYPNPQAARGTSPFRTCDNHLLLAANAGLGTADLARIDVCGLGLDKARHPYAPLAEG